MKGKKVEKRERKRKQKIGPRWMELFLLFCFYDERN